MCLPASQRRVFSTFRVGEASSPFDLDTKYEASAHLLIPSGNLDALRVSNVFWQTVLLGALERPIKVLIAEEGDVFRNDSLVVMHKHLGRYLYDASLKGIQNIGLFHTGDEENLVEKSTYAYADYVIRHCYFPSYRINKNTPDEGS